MIEHSCPALAAETKKDEPLGWSHVDLEARFECVRTRESNLANMFADILRIALQVGALRGI